LVLEIRASRSSRSVFRRIFNSENIRSKYPMLIVIEKTMEDLQVLAGSPALRNGDVVRRERLVNNIFDDTEQAFE
jgi:hypothetical protein